MCNYRGKNILVVGLGKSGIAAARFCAMRGANVTASDTKSADELADAISELSDVKVTFSLGQNDPVLPGNSDLIVASPGVPAQLPGFDDALTRGVPIVGEMELAVRELNIPIIAVTGTNGKTTTVSLIGHLLKTSGIRHVVAGNIGTPLLDVIDEAGESEVVVLEASSFQIETSPSLRPRIAIWLNVTPDHLDRHSTIESYVNCKAKMFDGMTENDFGIYNAADDKVFQAVMTSKCRLLPFDAGGRLFSGQNHKYGRAWFGDGDLWVDLQGGTRNCYPLNGVSLRGAHNRENMLAAIMASELSGADVEKMRIGLETFRGLPHRMEYACEYMGVSYYDDSKGTNVGATARALEECAEPVVLIAGGIAKGADFSSLKPLISKGVKHLVLIGESAGRMSEEFAGLAGISRASSMEDAVEKAASVADPGDVVLLSPACASFDMFRDYAERGEVFVSSVSKLMNEKKCVGEQ